MGVELKSDHFPAICLRLLPEIYIEVNLLYRLAGLWHIEKVPHAEMKDVYPK